MLRGISMEDCFQNKLLFHYRADLDAFSTELLKDSKTILWEKKC